MLVVLKIGITEPDPEVGELESNGEETLDGCEKGSLLVVTSGSGDKFVLSDDPEVV